MKIHSSAILKPIVSSCQLSIVLDRRFIISGMSHERDSLAKRMQEVCDLLKIPKAKRQTLFAKKYKKTPTTGRNWILGLKIPDYETACQICDDAKVNYEWLMTGEGLKYRESNENALIVTDPQIIKMIKQVEPLDAIMKNYALKGIDFAIQQAMQAKEDFNKK